MVPLKVLANRTAVLSIVASVAVGIAMFGGTTFLGQYFQVAQGYSPTKAGLMTIPLMVAAMLSSTIAGQIISRTGTLEGVPRRRWRCSSSSAWPACPYCATTPRPGRAASRWR